MGFIDTLLAHVSLWDVEVDSASGTGSDDLRSVNPGVGVAFWTRPWVESIALVFEVFAQKVVAR